MKHEVIKKADGGKTDYFEFEGISEYVEFCEKNVAKDSPARTERSISDWTWMGWDDAVKCASTGNREYVKDLFDRLEVLENSIPAMGFEEVRDVCGEYFDVGDVVSGEPECFRRMEAREVKPTIPVHVNFVQASCASASEIMNRGCAIVAMCDTLEKEGYRVELSMIHASNDRAKRPRRILYKVKMSNDPLDIDGVSFVLINPAFFRRLGFGFMHYVTGDPNATYKHHIDEFRDDEDMKLLENEVTSGIYFGADWAVRNKTRFRTIESAKQYVLDTLEKFKASPEKLIRA